MHLLSATSRFLILLSLVTTACRSVRSQQHSKPLPQDPAIQVYFNAVESAEYREPYRQQTRKGDDLEQQIVAAITAAQSTVDVAVQELRLPKIAQALVERQKAGVKVRVVLENNYSRPWSTLTATEIKNLPQRERDRYSEFRTLVDRDRNGELTTAEINQGDALVILRQAQIPWIDDTADGSAGSGLMHHKFIVIDNQTVIVTSANLTTSDVHGDFRFPDSRGNANNLLKINNPQLAGVFTEEFDLMWGDGPGGQPDSKFGLQKPVRGAKRIQVGNSQILVQYSPISPTLPWQQSSNGLIGQVLAGAVQSVELALFVFSEQRLADVLNSRQKNVQIRALIDSNFAYRYYSEALDMLGVALRDNCKHDKNNRPWQNAIATVGVPQLPQGDSLHHKFAVIDQHTVITGSHNWSDAANTKNDETLLVIQNPTIAAHYVREFERLYTNAQLGVPVNVQNKIIAQQQCSHQNASSANPPKLTSQDVDLKINLNTASVEELEMLPGVGKKLAQRIVSARQQKPFESLQDLDRVPGVGSSLIQRLRNRVTW